MKVITIGRGEDCNILIEDPMISRRHAVIRVFDSGKIEIVDYSTNGTSVNGVRLAPEKLTRISRKDVITFADKQTLDWSKIPNPGKPIKIAIGVAVALVVLLAVGFGVKAILNTFNDEPATTEEPQITTTTTDTESKGTDDAKSEDKSGKESVSTNNTNDSAVEGDAILEQQKKEQQQRQRRESAQASKNSKTAKGKDVKAEEPKAEEPKTEPEKKPKNRIRG